VAEAVTAASLDAALAEKGWATFELPDPMPVRDLQQKLLACLRAQGLSELGCLEDFHVLVRERGEYFERLYRLSRFYWDKDLGRGIIEANIDLFRSLMGPDLHIQRYPYLRAVRPGEPQDTAPLHRDTYYGASPYELSVVVALTDMPAVAALKVLSGSHLEPDSAYPYVQTTNEDVEIGSPRHQLGFAYAPRLLAAELEKRTTRVPLKVGEVAIFGLSLVHGGGYNHGDKTRFSTDIRITDSLAPVKHSRGVHEDYFVPLCSSAVSRTASQYERLR